MVNGVSFPSGYWFGRSVVRCAIKLDTGLPQELAQQMREVTRQIAGLTNELESLLPRRMRAWSMASFKR